MTEINELKQQIDRVENKLDALLAKMDISVKECNKMGEHIDFIENIYETIKYPLSFICDKVNIVIGNKTQENDTLENIKPNDHLLENS